MIIRTLALTTALLGTSLAQADWKVGAGSSISFASIKNTDKYEVHHFRDFDGFVTREGSATVNIQLASVDTGIAVRDERMRSLLMNVAEFPTAVLQVTVPSAVLAALKDGKLQTFESSGALALHGERVPVKASLMATPAADGSITVSTLTPLLLDASAFKLAEGIEKLREIAGLNTISRIIPVNVNLVFTPE